MIIIIIYLLIFDNFSSPSDYTNSYGPFSCYYLSFIGELKEIPSSLRYLGGPNYTT